MKKRLIELGQIIIGILAGLALAALIAFTIWYKWKKFTFFLTH